jgi:hypothetical protein
MDQLPEKDRLVLLSLQDEFRRWESQIYNDIIAMEQRWPGLQINAFQVHRALEDGELVDIKIGARLK